MGDANTRKVVPFSTGWRDGRITSTVRIRPGGMVTIGRTLDLKRGSALMLDKLIIHGDADRWEISEIRIDGEFQPFPWDFIYMRPAKRRIDLGVRYIGTDVNGEVFSAALTAALIACTYEEQVDSAKPESEET